MYDCYREKKSLRSVVLKRGQGIAHGIESFKTCFSLLINCTDSTTKHLPNFSKEKFNMIILKLRK